ncbi:MAG: AraC family transcriptional regulator [Bacteroidota bacterium]
MPTYHLPSYFHNHQEAPDFFVYDYTSEVNTERAQVALSGNLFSFLQDGTKTVFLADDTITATPTHFLVLKAGHCLMTEKISDQARYRSQLFFSTTQALRTFCHKYQIEPSLEPQMDSCLKLPYDSFLLAFVNSLRALPSLNAQDLLAVKFEELMLYLQATHGQRLIDFLFAPAQPKQEQVLEVALHAVDHPLSLEEMAFLCHMSISTFQRTFRRQFHTSPQKWLQGQRLKKAAYLLAVKGMRPSEVFPEAGYESLSSFSQAFQRLYGQSPRQYQEQHHS